MSKQNPELPELMPIERLHDKAVNANRLAGQEYKNTLEDIREHGIQEKLKIIPRDVYHGKEELPHDEYVIEDGSQRFRIAKSLGIKEVPYEIVERMEADSLALNYRHQANRGSKDPFEEAELFNYYLEKQGLTQNETVELLKLENRDYLTNRIVLNKISEEVRHKVRYLEDTIKEMLRAKYEGLEGVVDDLEEKINKEGQTIVQRCTIHLSHLRVIGSVPVDKQMELLDTVLDGFFTGQPVSTKILAGRAKSIKDHIDYAEKYAKAQLDAVRPMCPACGKAAMGFYKPFAEGPDYSLFACSNCSNDWDYSITDEEQKAQEEAARKAAEEDRDKFRAERLMGIHENRPDLTEAQLIESYWFSGPFQDQEASNEFVKNWLQEHPEVELAEPEPEPTVETEKIVARATIDDVKPPVFTPEPEEEHVERVPDEVRETIGTLPQTIEILPKYKVERMGRVVNALEHALHHLSKDGMDEFFHSQIIQLDIIKEQIRVRYLVEANLRLDAEAEKQDLEAEPPFGAPVSKAPQGELIVAVPDHGREYGIFTCLKCGEPETEGNHVDDYGICDSCAGREYRENPIWCQVFRNVDHSQPYCDTPELGDECDLCPVYIENMKAEEKRSKGSVLCAHCNTQVSDTIYCLNCGEKLLPGEPDDPEEPEHTVTENEQKWLNTPVKGLRKLREDLLVEEAEYLLEHETRKSALGLLSKHLETFTDPIPAEDD